MAKSSGITLFADVQPAEGAPLHEPLSLWRKHQAEAERLEALLARRQAELEAAWAEEVAPVTVDSEPVGIDAQARASRLQAIIGEIKRTLARERTAALQARHQAQNLWSPLFKLEQDYLNDKRRSEELEGKQAAKHAESAKQRLEELQKAYRQTVGLGYKPGACGAVATWVKPVEDARRAYKRLIVEAARKAMARRGGLSDADRYQQLATPAQGQRALPADPEKRQSK